MYFRWGVKSESHDVNVGLTYYKTSSELENEMELIVRLIVINQLINNY